MPDVRDCRRSICTVCTQDVRTGTGTLSSSFARHVPFPLVFRPRPCVERDPYLNFDLVLAATRNIDEPSGFELEYNSVGYAKAIRLGVDVLDERSLVVRPKKSGTLSKEVEGDGIAAVTGVQGLS